MRKVRSDATSRWARYRFRVLVWLTLLAIPAWPAVTSAADQVSPAKGILVLYYYGKDYPANVEFEEGVLSALKSTTPGEFEYYPEYLEPNRFPGKLQSEAFQDYLRKKYADHRVDVVIAQTDIAFGFLMQYRGDLFPTTPIVFFARKRPDLSIQPGEPGYSGVVAEHAYQQTLDLALSLHPSTKRVYVITGTPENDPTLANIVQEQLRPFESRLEVNYLTNLPLDEMLRKVKNAPQGSIILYVRYSQDEPGKTLGPREILALVAQSSNVPIYGIAEGFIGHGIVGGYVFRQQEAGKRLAEMALQIANGAQAADIPIEKTRLVPIFDWRQLRKWNIPESQLPTGSIVTFKEPTVWDLYKWRILGAISLIILQALGIGWLLFTRAKRRQAELAKEKLATIVETSDDAILSKTLEGTITSWNAGAEKMYGYSANEMVGQHVSILIPPDLKEELAGILDRIERGENVDHLETVRVTRGGRLIDVSLTISSIRDEHGKIIGASTIARDISRRKQAIKDLQESEERFRMMADTAPVMVWVSGPDTLCTFFNRPWLEFTGRTLEQEMGNGWAEGVHPADYQRCLDVYLSAFKARRNFTMEYRLRRADGKYRWMVDTGVPRMLPSGDFAGYIGSCVDISERKRDEELLQELTGRLLMLQDQERKRVAAELHDGLGQNLAIIKNRAMIGLRDQSNQDRVMEQLEEIAATATSSILEVREIAHNLRPYELDRLGLAAAIESMIERVSETTAIRLSSDLERIDGLLSSEAETSVYRMVQEGLNNIIKHSHATEAKVSIGKSAKQLIISISDNGTGIVPPAPGDSDNKRSGFGLVGMAERVRVLGGSLAVNSEPSHGTTIDIRLELTNGRPE